MALRNHAAKGYILHHTPLWSVAVHAHEPYPRRWSVVNANPGGHLEGTRDMGLAFLKGGEEAPTMLADAGFASDKDSRKSVPGGRCSHAACMVRRNGDWMVLTNTSSLRRNIVAQGQIHLAWSDYCIGQQNRCESSPFGVTNTRSFLWSDPPLV